MRDHVAAIMAATVGLAVVALAAGAAIEIADTHAQISQHVATILSTVLGALVGALAGYLGNNADQV